MSKYNANVRVGNWYDELIMQEEILKQYIRRNENSKLKIQKARKLFLSLLTQVPLTFPVRGLCYGAVIQIMSKEAPTNGKFMLEKNQGMVLACDINYQFIDMRTTFYDGDPVMASGLLTSCVRNVWSLVPCDAPSAKDKPVLYGESLYIKFHGSQTPLYMEAMFGGPMVPRGECGQIVPKLVSRPSANSRFKVVHVDRLMRYETEGQPVPPFEKVVLLHVMSSQALAIECDTWVPTYFGMECEVSVKNYFVDLKRPYRHTFKNFWCLMLSSTAN